MRRLCVLCFSIVTLLVFFSEASAVNNIHVPSMNVAPNATGVVIPALLTNDVELAGITIPLMIRSVSGGAYITAIRGSFSDRLPIDGPMSDIVFVNHYAFEDGTCKWYSPGDPPGEGGFQTIVANDTNSHPVSASPYALLFVRWRTTASNLAPGADATGSLLMTVDINNQEGVFEIDTTCVDPTNHVWFIKPGMPPENGVLPDVTKGLITVGTPENNPPVADNDVYGGAREGATLYVVGSGVLTNDTDADGDPLTAVLDMDAGNGTLLLEPEGSFFYTPDVGFIGTDQFSYFANDGVSNSAVAATVTLHVKGGGPVPPGDYDEDGEITALDLAATIDALFANGPDPTDGGCRLWPRGDFNCDTFTTAVDLALLIDHAFRSGQGPCDPCAQ